MRVRGAVAVEDGEGYLQKTQTSLLAVAKKKHFLFAGTLAPAREIPGGDGAGGGDGNIEDTIMYIMTNVNLIVPVVAAVAVIVIAIVVICVLRGGRREQFPKGN
jgi:hypothetical protein